jgi:hypothetical protein
VAAFITYLGDDNVYHALTTIPIDGIEFTEQAEEGSVAMTTVPVDDAGVAFEVRGLRGFAVYETDIPSGETRVYNGFTADREYTPLDGVSPMGRTVNLSLTDTNLIWGLRVMVGADCKRPAETDVQRMQWLVTTAEAGLITDTTFLFTGNPVHMDAVDYRGATMDSVANDCAQASGKNWFLTYDSVSYGGVMIWYGKDEHTAFDSGCLLTNDHSLIDNATVFAISADTKINLDPGRVYSGIYGVYAKGAIYRQLHSTAAAFKHRDKVMQMPFVKTKAKAIARVERYLTQCDEEDVRIETTIWVSSIHANAVRCGQRVRFQSTMAAETLTAIECRVVKRTMSYWAPSSGGGHGMWKVDLELVGGAAASTCGGVVQSTTAASLGTEVALVWPAAPIAGNRAIAMFSTRDLANVSPPISRVPPAGADVAGTDYTWLCNAESANFNAQSVQLAWRHITGSDTTVHRWYGLSGSCGPVAASIEIDGTADPEGPWTAEGPNALTMTISGISPSGPGILALAFNLSGFDIPPHTLTPPSDMVEIVSGYERLSSGTQDWQSFGYVVIPAAGTYSYSWTVSNIYNWRYSIAASFFPADICT